MATIYLSYADGTDQLANGGSWAAPIKTLEYAVETKAVDLGAGPHTILWDHTSAETLSADTTITAAHDLRIISVNRSGGDAHGAVRAAALAESLAEGEAQQVVA